MIYLVVGLDGDTYSRWHQNIVATDPGAASTIARRRAAAHGRRLVVAAVIGPGAEVLSDAGPEVATAV